MTSTLIWGPEFEIGVPEIDQQHHRLFDILNRLIEATEKNQTRDVIWTVLEEIVDYTQTHFASEEALMKKIQHAGLDEQKELHAKFVARLEELRDGFWELKEDLAKDTILFLGEWLMDHILIEDRKIAATASKKAPQKAAKRAPKKSPRK